MTWVRPLAAPGAARARSLLSLLLMRSAHLLLHDDIGGQPFSAVAGRRAHHGVGVVTQVALRDAVLLLHLGAGQHQRRGAVGLRTGTVDVSGKVKSESIGGRAGHGDVYERQCQSESRRGCLRGTWTHL